MRSRIFGLLPQDYRHLKCVIPITERIDLWSHVRSLVFRSPALPGDLSRICTFKDAEDDCLAPRAASLFAPDPSWFEVRFIDFLFSPRKGFWNSQC